MEPKWKIWLLMTVVGVILAACEKMEKKPTPKDFFVGYFCACFILGALNWIIHS